MKGRECKGGAPPTDLLVCFPSRARLTLMPKAICSPARPTDQLNSATKRHHRRRHLHHLGTTTKSYNRGGQASPLLWAKTKSMGSEIDEPTSPKVTCAGQIKVRPTKPSGGSCKNWQSVMEEIERLHNKNNRKDKKNKRPSWVESFGFKKDVMQFLTCLRGIRFDLRCFGSFHGSVVTSDDDEEEEEEENDDDGIDDEEEQEESDVKMEVTDGNGSSRTVFSKWFMVLQEENNQENGFFVKENKVEEEEEKPINNFSSGSVPPANALLLMRCKSAPAKSWLEEKAQEEQEEKKKKKKEKLLMEEEEEKKKKEESLILKCYAPDFFKVSSDIAKETWVVGGTRSDPFSRSRSWKR